MPQQRSDLSSTGKGLASASMIFDKEIMSLILGHRLVETVNVIPKDQLLIREPLTICQGEIVGLC